MVAAKMLDHSHVYSSIDVVLNSVGWLQPRQCSNVDDDDDLKKYGAYPGWGNGQVLAARGNTFKISYKLDLKPLCAVQAALWQSFIVLVIWLNKHQYSAIKVHYKKLVKWFSCFSVRLPLLQEKEMCIFLQFIFICAIHIHIFYTAKNPLWDFIIK